ncbi:long-chain fatty acid--CoA ligase [Streptomyces sp. NPDC006285]|uniref:long-chain-fatty-acid--CoA ligase n=1 Tax=Streptomyces sp. NPDC006285 TaxID=3364742 RepID=UPI00369CF904
MLNLAVLLEDSARRHPTREAVVCGDTRLSYAQVDATANQVANLLVSRGIKPGDKVALSSPNIPWFPIVYYGILKMGAVVVPLNVLLKRREIAYALRDCDARAYVCFEGTSELPMGLEGVAGFEQAPECEHLFVIAEPTSSSPLEDVETLGEALTGRPTVFDSLPTESTDTAVVLYTSGTTGQPKGAELTHANLTLNALTTHRLLACGEGTDIHLIVLPLFHSFGQTLQMHTAFFGGNTLVLMPRFEPAAALRTMLQEKVTYFAGVPTMYHGLLAALPGEAETEQLAANLRIAISGGAAMPVELLDQVREKTGVRVMEGYGLSETSPAICFTPFHGEHRPGSIGSPIWGVELKLIDSDGHEIADTADNRDAIGEIAVKGHPVMKGYLNRPEESAAVLKDGWFRTGDLARKDADGYYYIVGRAKEMIIRGGYNVYPRELEEVLMTHPAVSMVAVVGVPDERLGEEIKAFVLKTPGDPTTEAELVSWSREQFAAYKYPRTVTFVDGFPMTGAGKILKREL